MVTPDPKNIFENFVALQQLFSNPIHFFFSPYNFNIDMLKKKISYFLQVNQGKYMDSVCHLEAVVSIIMFCFLAIEVQSKI